MRHLIQTSNLSSTVDSDGRTLHVPNLVRGKKKYHPYCLKQGNKPKKSKIHQATKIHALRSVHVKCDV